MKIGEKYQNLATTYTVVLVKDGMVWFKKVYSKLSGLDPLACYMIKDIKKAIKKGYVKKG